MKALRTRDVRDAYDRWAPTYGAVPHNPLMHIEQRAMLACFPDVRGRGVLDLGSGSGRYADIALHKGARDVVALDLSMSMLSRSTHRRRVQADLCRLPFAPGSFDCAIAGLAVGHAADVFAAFASIGRVLAREGTFLFSDFHPAASAVGLERTFTDEHGRKCNVPHIAHGVGVQRAALLAAGFVIEAVIELKAGEDFDEVFDGSDTFYARWRGLPLVLVMRARR